MSPSAFSKMVGAVVLAGVPPLISGLFAYKQAQAEAGAGYETLLKATEESQKELRSLHDRVVTLEAWSQRPTPRMAKPETWPAVVEPKGPNAEAAMQPPAPAKAYRPKVLPETLHDAFMQHTQSKK